jgi:hypothetical protein
MDKSMEDTMQGRGFAEPQATYASDDPRRLVGQFRRFGPDGPAYQIMAVDEEGRLHVEVVYSDEKVICTLAEVLEDPIAETIP